MEEKLGHNIPTFTVSELATSIRQTLEGTFGRVRLRGEVSGFKKHTSGHLYLSLRDEQSLISAVCWKGVAMRLPFIPEDGMEIITTGRLTTYGGRSQYQIIIENVELAGQGALLKLLEDRKKKLLAEGLFDPAKKKTLPFLPKLIGVITSPTGAVFSDIIHRLKDRFPRHVLLWPTSVQGEKAEAEITQAIWGFQGLEPDGKTPLSLPFSTKPDLIILARGGGSLEDLWCFNEESVIRAVSACSIPIITAIGHETDTTLVDFSADKRAPTPTGAAEMAVPVRADLLFSILDSRNRVSRIFLQRLETHKKYLQQLSRHMERPSQLLERAAQRLDDLSERLPNAIKALLNTQHLQLITARQHIQTPHTLLETTALKINQLSQKLNWLAKNGQKEKKQKLQESNHFLRFSFLEKKIQNYAQDLSSRKRLLESLSYKNTLDRGFSLVTDSKGNFIDSKKQAALQSIMTVTFHDGNLTVTPKIEKKKKTTPFHDTSFPDLFRR